jgi:hypothetical protein
MGEQFCLTSKNQHVVQCDNNAYSNLTLLLIPYDTSRALSVNSMITRDFAIHEKISL